MRAKRGLSKVVSAIIIILIVMLAIVLLWLAVKRTEKKVIEQTEQTTDCLGVMLKIESIECTELGGKKVKISREDSGKDLEDVAIIFKNDLETKTVYLGRNFKALETTTKIFNISLDNPTGADSIIPASKEISISAVIKDGSGERFTCPEGDTKEVECGEKNFCEELKQIIKDFLLGSTNPTIVTDINKDDLTDSADLTLVIINQNNESWCAEQFSAP